MNLRDRILCTLTIERAASVARLAELTQAPHAEVYRAVYELSLARLVMRPAPATYMLTDFGDGRAQYLLRQLGELRRQAEALFTNQLTDPIPQLSEADRDPVHRH